MTRKTRTLIVTGGSSGIGRSIVERQIHEGMRVIGISRDFSNVPDYGESFVPIELDFSDLETAADHLTVLSRKYPEVTGVICSAGRGRFGSLEEFSYADIRSLMDLNFTSQAYVIRAFLPILKRNGRGDIVIIGSEAALTGGARGAIYSASKSALRALAQSLRAESATSGVRVTTINPGMVRTRFFETLDFEPGPDPDNFIDPDDVAKAVDSVLAMRTGTVVDEINLSPLKKVIRKKNQRDSGCG
jgi:short-subunit dehydrogenase